MHACVYIRGNNYHQKREYIINHKEQCLYGQYEYSEIWYNGKYFNRIENDSIYIIFVVTLIKQLNKHCGQHNIGVTILIQYIWNTGEF